MRIIVLAEQRVGERRVALTPEAVAKLIGDGHQVEIERNAGAAAGFDDDAYSAAGAHVANDRQTAIGTGGVLLAVTRPDLQDLTGLGAGHALIALLDPLWHPAPMADLAASGVAALSLELVPRITRAQSMDVLSSMATVTGYQAVLEGAVRLPRMFPLLMTAAGTVPSARVFILGAGVAGLQAIATARRLGAVVEGFDIRPAAAEQIRSLGAKAVELDLGRGGDADADGQTNSRIGSEGNNPEENNPAGSNPEDAGGYARSQAADEQSRQQAALTPFVAASDLIITTAAIPGARSPLLITAKMVEAMRPDSLIIDMAAERGGNCEVTVANETVIHAGVMVLGPTQLESGSARSASLMFANNLVTLIRHLADESGDLDIDSEDEITGAMLVTSGGKIVHPRVAAALEPVSTDPSTDPSVDPSADSTADPSTDPPAETEAPTPDSSS